MGSDFEDLPTPKRLKTGGRKKGSKNKRLKLTEAEEISRLGELPLGYMVRIMRDPTASESRRDRMANAAAPYLHAKLVSSEVKVEQTVNNKSASELTKELLENLVNWGYLPAAVVETGVVPQGISFDDSGRPESTKLN